MKQWRVVPRTDTLGNQLWSLHYHHNPAKEKDMKPGDPLPERDPSEVMDRFELAALEEVLDNPDDFVDAPRPS